MRSKSIVVIGSSNTDLIIRVPRIPKAGETLLGGEFMSAAGGKGANQAVGAARSGGRAALIARVGTDAFGDRAVVGLRRAELLTGIKVTDEAAAARACAKLRSRGVRTVILTLGARGAYLADAGGQLLVPGFKVKAVDSTAAGDIFNGALAVALAERKTLRDAVRFANAAAALSVTRLGAQPSAPTRVEIERFLGHRK